MGCKLSFPKRPKKDRFRALKSQIVELEEEINTLKFRFEEVEEDFSALKRLLWFDIETVIFRYEHIAWQIFDELDDKNLGNCRLVCKSWKECIDNGKSFWICLHQRFKNLPILEIWDDEKHSILDEFPDMRIVFDYLKTNANATELKILLDFFKELKKRYCRQGMHRFTDDHPLHYAASNGRLEILELLLKSGIDPNAPNHCGKTIFQEYPSQIRSFKSKHFTAKKMRKYPHDVAMPPNQFLLEFRMWTLPKKHC